MCLFVVTGIVLHATYATGSIFAVCPGLWESMTLMLSLKCVRITLCKITMHRFDVHPKISDYFDMLFHLIHFCVECVITSFALNSSECVNVMASPFGGHPMIAYVNGLWCAWDGCLALSVALYATINRGGKYR